MKFDGKNTRLIQFKELREAVISNTVKIEEPKRSERKESDSSLLLFSQ